MGLGLAWAVDVLPLMGVSAARGKSISLIPRTGLGSRTKRLGEWYITDSDSYTCSLSSSATSYLSSCISAGCANGVNDWTTDLSSMLGLYDSYCATANAAIVTTVPATITDASSSAPSGTSKGQGNTGAPKTETGTETTSATTAPSSDKAGGGLSQSDIVALGASLGVGIPSLLIALLTLWVQLRKRKQKAEKSESMVHMVPLGGYGTGDANSHEMSGRPGYK